jgi:hypothetical protein
MYILENMANQLNRIETPIGLRRDNPFQSCLDLHDQSMTGNEIVILILKKFFFYEGKYWIDPNHGSTSDAIEVNCIIESDRKKTCIQPNDNQQKQVKNSFFLRLVISNNSLD